MVGTAPDAFASGAFAHPTNRGCVPRASLRANGSRECAPDAAKQSRVPGSDRIWMKAFEAAGKNNNCFNLENLRGSRLRESLAHKQEGGLSENASSVRRGTQ